MTTLRKLAAPTPLTWLAIGVSAIAIGILLTFPANPVIWEATTWTLVAALAALLVLVLVSAYALARNPGTRTWPRIASFVAGFACLVALAAASL